MRRTIEILRAICEWRWVASHGCLTKVWQNKLLIFERKITRKIFGPTRTDDGYWRIKTKQEINDILKGQNIIGFIKKQRLNWLGHVERMAEDNIVQKIKRWKPMSKRPIGRPKTRWEDDVLEDIKSINIRNWKTVAQNWDSWMKVVEQARILYRLQRFIGSRRRRRRRRKEEEGGLCRVLGWLMSNDLEGIKEGNYRDLTEVPYRSKKIMEIAVVTVEIRTGHSQN